MIPYIGIYAFLTFLMFFRPSNCQKTIIFVVLSIFLNLAYTNGIDWTSYQGIYAFNTFQTRGIEYGYTAISLLAKSFGLNFEVFKFLLLSFDLIVILNFVFRQSTKPAFVVLILFQTYLLGNFFEPAIRQIQSIVIFLFSFDALVKGNLYKYLSLILFATLFHQSALVLALLPWFIRKIDLKTSFFALIILGIIGLAINSVVLFLIKFGIFHDYQFYLNSSFLEGIDLSPFNVAKVVIYAFPLYILRNFRRTDPTVETLRALSYLFVVFFILQFSALLFYRFNQFFIIPYLIYISFVLSEIRKSNLKQTLVAFYVVIHFISLIKGLSYYSVRDPMKYFPYTNYAIAIATDSTYDSVREKISVRLNSRWQHLAPFLDPNTAQGNK